MSTEKATAAELVDRLARHWIEHGRTDTFGEPDPGNWEHIKAHKPISLSDARRKAEWAIAAFAAAKPECPYCGATEGLRIKCDSYGPIAPELTCEACFTGTDTGPSFDDLKPA